MKSFTVPVFALLASLTIGVGLAGALVRLNAQVTAQADACMPSSRALVRRELVFGTARAQGAIVSAHDWQGFLDSTVTPRFPDGFTVLDAYGQWHAGGGLTKEQSRILVIWHERSPKLDAEIESIRSAYKERFDQESVLRIESISCVSF